MYMGGFKHDRHASPRLRTSENFEGQNANVLNFSVSSGSGGRGRTNMYP